MTRWIAAVALVALAGCHRPQADQPTLDAAADAQARTAAKTRDDLAAADAAAQGPIPEAVATRPWREQEQSDASNTAVEQPRGAADTAKVTAVDNAAAPAISVANDGVADAP